MAFNFNGIIDAAEDAQERPQSNEKEAAYTNTRASEKETPQPKLQGPPASPTSNRIDNTKKEIAGALLAGGDTAVLLLKACHALALATGDAAFYEDVKSKLYNLYGEVWGNNNILDMRLSDAWERYHLLFTEQVEASKKAHEQYIAKLDKMAG